MMSLPVSEHGLLPLCGISATQNFQTLSDSVGRIANNAIKYSRGSQRRIGQVCHESIAEIVYEVVL